MVVGDPELLEGFCEVLELLDALDDVAAEGEDAELGEAVQIYGDAVDAVRGEGEVLAVLESVKGVVELGDWGDLGVELGWAASVR